MNLGVSARLPYLDSYGIERFAQKNLNSIGSSQTFSIYAGLKYLPKINFFLQYDGEVSLENPENLPIWFKVSVGGQVKVIYQFCYEDGCASIEFGPQEWLDTPISVTVTLLEIGIGIAPDDGCDDSRPFTDQYRISLQGLDLFGQVTSYSALINHGKEWLHDDNFSTPFGDWKSITRLQVRPVGGTGKNGQINFSIKRWQSLTTIPLTPIGWAEQIINGLVSGSHLMIAFANATSIPCHATFDIDFTETGLDTVLWQRFFDIKLDWYGFNDAETEKCCDDESDESEEWGGEEPIPEPRQGQDCCDALWIYVYGLHARIEVLEEKMTEIKTGLDCICAAIQALSGLQLSPVIEVKPADSVNEINLPELSPVIEVHPATNQNLIQVAPCEPIVNNILEDVTIKGGVAVSLENLEAIQAAIVAALSCGGVNITCVIASLLEKIQALVDQGALDLDKYFIDEEKNLLKVMRELLTTTDPCINQEKTIAQIVEEKDLMLIVENEMDIRTVENRSINKCCPTAEK